MSNSYTTSLSMKTKKSDCMKMFFLSLFCTNSTQLIRYARACHNYANFLYSATLLTIKLLEQVYLLQDCSRYYRIFMLVIMKLWIVTVEE